jgi:hypothetical protein
VVEAFGIAHRDHVDTNTCAERDEASDSGVEFPGESIDDLDGRLACTGGAVDRQRLLQVPEDANVVDDEAVVLLRRVVWVESTRRLLR